MDNLFLEQFKSHYSALLLAEGFIYEDKSISDSKFFDNKFFSVLTIPNENGDILHIEETAKNVNVDSKYKKYNLYFSFNTEDSDEKTSRMLHYLEQIFNIKFKLLKILHDTYLQAGLDIGLFVKTGDVIFKPHLLLSHFDTSIINKKSKVIIDNIKYKPLLKKIIKTKKIVLNFGISQYFENGKLYANFDTNGLVFFDKTAHVIHVNNFDCLAIYKPNSVNSSTEFDPVYPSLLYTYFYDYFKERIDTKFFNMDIDLNNISQELFEQYLDVTDMVKI